jgi:hypothetical protein
VSDLFAWMLFISLVGTITIFGFFDFVDWLIEQIKDAVG